MVTFKEAMAFPLYGTVGYLVWVLAGQVGESGLLNVLIGLTAVAMSAWLYGRYTAPGSKPARVRFGFIGGACLLALGAWLGWPHPAAPNDIVWEKWSPAAVSSAQQAGKTVYVDFTARWCATCQANKHLVFGSDDVKRLFRDRGIVTLKGDWTNHDPEITAELARFGRSAVPFNLIYKPGITEPVALPELLTAATVLSALR
jgi:thiol:disulfide interchange protein DsbD